MALGSSEKTLCPITADQPKVSALLAYFIPCKANLDSQMNKVVAVSAIEIVKGKPEGPLNNFMADAMYSSGKLKTSYRYQKKSVGYGTGKKRQPY